jgi:hypothetical protein
MDLCSIKESGQRVWVITSGETYKYRDYYLSEKQNEWLSEVEKEIKPVYVGRDNATGVYLLESEVN